MSRRFNRRNFLVGLGAFGASGYLNSMLKGFITKSIAAEMGVKPRAYVHMSQFGAPTRWVFDLLLNPTNSSSFVSDPGWGNRFVATGGNYTQVEHALVNLKGIWVPPLWNSLDGLLDNALFLRGIDPVFADHHSAFTSTMLPPGEPQSNLGVVADASTNPLAAIGINQGLLNFRSIKGRSLITMNASPSANALEKLLKPFNLDATIRQTTRSRIAPVEEEFTLALEALERDLETYAPEVRLNRRDAEELLWTGYENLGGVWTDLSGKYLALIASALVSPIAGISDLPIGDPDPTKTRGGPYFLEYQPVPVATFADLRALLGTSPEIRNLAEVFALTEFILVNDLSSAIGFDAGFVRAGGKNYGHDHHGEGFLVSTFLDSHFHLAYGKCLSELITVLKSRIQDGVSKFENTVLVTHTEFNRAPRTDGSGSDHSFHGASAMIHSGIVTGPLVVGNINNKCKRPGFDQNIYKGTYGEGAVIESLGRAANTTDFAATLQTLVGLTPTPRGSSLIRINAGKVESAIGPAKIEVVR